MGTRQGGVGMLKVGAPSQHDREIKKQRGEEAIAAARAAAEEGVVAGGGAAYLACIPALDTLAKTLAADGRPEERDQALGVRCLIRALQAPTEWIVRNAGHNPRPILAQLRDAPPGHGFDITQNRIADMHEAGILDPLKVVRTALEI